MDKPKVMSVYGTRPEAIKLAPVIKALENDPRFDSIPVSTGQHKEMLDQVNRMFGIMPAFDLELMKDGQGLNSLVSRALAGLDPILEEVNPDVIIVQGDTSTAMAAAIAGFHRNVKVVHLEAGLRTGDINSPFPEEANRTIISRVASLHLAPTKGTSRNLIAEGISENDIIVTGNTVIDALFEAVTWSTLFEDPVLREFEVTGARLVVVTTHRRENLSALKKIGAAIHELATEHPDVFFVLPLHSNPAVRGGLLPEVQSLDNVVITNPLPYDQFTKLLNSATLVLSDSGGIQEEAPSLGTPVLVMRDKTERPEAIEAGTVRLVGTDRERIVTETRRLLNDRLELHAMANAVNPYGDGFATSRTVAAIGSLVGVSERPEPFVPEIESRFRRVSNG